MADGFDGTLDDAGLLTALNMLGSAADPYINEASKVTAEDVATEARNRLQRALGPTRRPTLSRPDLGHDLTLKGIAVIPSFPVGYSVIDAREPFRNVPLFEERGTRSGEGSHDFFYPSAALNVESHRQRISDALQKAIDEQGLGD